ncbi:hypothetical protein ABTZ93_16990 [Streptomyces sp. NPDC097941]|uniref:hypothetical protein n=1 Tax=Streptomyces sp. NPDC097941 TaxID=3155685 RepID=UPI00332140F1
MEQSRAAEREARRPVCQERGEKFTDQRWKTDYLAGRKAAAEAARVQAAAPALAAMGARPTTSASASRTITVWSNFGMNNDIPGPADIGTDLLRRGRAARH